MNFDEYFISRLIDLTRTRISSSVLFQELRVSLTVQKIRTFTVRGVGPALRLQVKLSLEESQRNNKWHANVVDLLTWVGGEGVDVQTE